MNVKQIVGLGLLLPCLYAGVCWCPVPGARGGHGADSAVGGGAGRGTLLRPRGYHYYYRITVVLRALPGWPLGATAPGPTTRARCVTGIRTEWAGWSIPGAAEVSARPAVAAHSAIALEAPAA